MWREAALVAGKDLRTLVERYRRRKEIMPTAMAVFLASPGARNITGQCFNVDGGLIMD